MWHRKPCSYLNAMKFHICRKLVVAWVKSVGWKVRLEFGGLVLLGTPSVVG